MSASLSVAIVTYDTPPGMLGRTLESLAAAIEEARARGVLADAQVFLIDNAEARAPARTVEAVRAWPGSAGSIEVLRGHGNVGYARANNLVLDRLRSDVHLVMNPDVELASDALHEGVRALEMHPDVGLLAPAVFDARGERQYLCRRYPSALVLLLRGFAPRALQHFFQDSLARYEMRDVIGERFVDEVPLASGCFMLARTALFLRLGGFDARFFLYFEDYDLSVRLSREARIAYDPQMRIVHHGGDAARKGLHHIAWFARSAWRFFSLHGFTAR
jgi:GT2 family glycosyltransferase